MAGWAHTGRRTPFWHKTHQLPEIGKQVQSTCGEISIHSASPTERGACPSKAWSGRRAADSGAAVPNINTSLAHIVTMYTGSGGRLTQGHTVAAAGSVRQRLHAGAPGARGGHSGPVQRRGSAGGQGAVPSEYCEPYGGPPYCCGRPSGLAGGAAVSAPHIPPVRR